MIKFRYFYGVLLLVILTFTSYASTMHNNKDNKFSGLKLMKQVEQQGQTKGDPLLLFSNIHISGVHSGNMYIVGGEIRIDGEINGSIYVYDGKIYIGEEGVIKGNIKTISTNVIYHQNARIEGSIEPIMNTLNVFKKQWSETLFSHYTDNIPFFILELARIVIQMILSLLFLSLFKKTVTLQGVFLINQTKDVLYRGFVLYLMGVALILIFILSLVGFPFALLLLLVSWVLSGLGETALSIIIGEWIREKIYIQEDIYISFWVGISLLQLGKSIPVFGYITSIFIIPLLSLGMFAQILVNKLMDVPHGFVEEDCSNDLNPYHQDKLYIEITKNLTKKGGR